jgi:hypothetical protein
VRISSPGPKRRIRGEQRVDELAFIAKSGQHREIDVQRDARLAPSLYRQAADEERAPALSVTENLQLPGRLEKIDHRGIFANHSCIWTNPDEGLSGEVRKA